MICKLWVSALSVVAGIAADIVFGKPDPFEPVPNTLPSTPPPARLP